MLDSVKNWSTQIKKGYLDLCILCLIATESQVYGFKLISILQESEIEIKEGTLYPLLNRMTKDGLLKSYWDTRETQGPRRKFYSLTSLGKIHLKEMTKQYEIMTKTFQKIKKRTGV